MLVPGSANPLLLSSGASKFMLPQGSGYSVRFRGSAYFSKTPPGGSLTAWSVAFWIKRAEAKTSGIYQTLIGALVGSGSTTEVGFGTNYNNAVYFVWNSFNYVISTEAYLDEAHWIHVVYVWDTNNAVQTDRIRTYINGVRTTPRAGASFPGLGQTSFWNGAYSSFIGSWGGSSQQFHGYMSDFVNVDGLALDCNAFGQFTPEGLWIPKPYTGAWGKSGFHLDFKDPAQIGKDVSGNNNHWTPNSFDTAAPGTQATYDWVKDFPQPYDDGTPNPPGNYAVLDEANPSKSTLTNANLTASGTTDLPSLKPTSGNWYFEINDVGKQWTPPAPFPSAAGNYNFGQRPFKNAVPAGYKAICLTNMM